METVTEGVETREDEALIQSMGCNYGQGYYYSMPIPVKDFYNIFLKKT
ncbi:EAL domain-containing protein [Lawsonibacter sp. LCP25S3_G6]